MYDIPPIMVHRYPQLFSSLGGFVGYQSMFCFMEMHAPSFNTQKSKAFCLSDAHDNPRKQTAFVATITLAKTGWKKKTTETPPHGGPPIKNSCKSRIPTHARGADKSELNPPSLPAAEDWHTKLGVPRNPTCGLLLCRGGIGLDAGRRH